MIEATHRPRASQRGFSMAEVLVAVALLAVILLALFGLVTAGVQRAYGGKKMTQATTIAQAVMERANVYEAQSLIDSADTDSRTVSWTRLGNVTTNDATNSTDPESPADTDAKRERNAWRAMLANADLPTSGQPATLSVTVDAVGSGGVTFTNAEMIRITVDLTWHEWGKRRRQVRLQALNLPEEP